MLGWLSAEAARASRRKRWRPAACSARRRAHHFHRDRPVQPRVEGAVRPRPCRRCRCAHRRGSARKSSVSSGEWVRSAREHYTSTGRRLLPEVLGDFEQETRRSGESPESRSQLLVAPPPHLVDPNRRSGGCHTWQLNSATVRCAPTSARGAQSVQRRTSETDSSFCNIPSRVLENSNNLRRRTLCSQGGMERTGAEIEALTERIIGCAIEVHRTLGPGLLESVYRECLIIELTTCQLRVESERRVPLEYKGHRIRGDLKLDLLVEDCVVAELKSVERLHPVHVAQVITYLKLTGCPAGLLINFNSTAIRAGLRRVDHPGAVR